MLKVFKSRLFPLLGSHFLSSVNDSFLRMVFLFFVTYKMTQTSSFLLMSAVILHALFFCVGSIFSGQFADKISKKKFLLFFRLFEIGVMGAALFSVFFDSRWLLVLILGASGFSGACVRIGDYSVLPALANKKELLKWNAFIKVLGVLGGTCASLLLMGVLKFDMAYDLICTTGFVLAIVSFLITLRLPSFDAADPDSRIERNPIKVFDFVAQTLKHQFDKWAVLVGIAWFWVLGSLVLFFSAEYGRLFLNARWSVVVFVTSAIFPVGYVLGAWLCARSGKNKPLGLNTAWVGALLSVVLFDFVFASRSLALSYPEHAITVFKLLTTSFDYWRIVIDVLLFGVLAAMFVIPFYTLLQRETSPKIMGRMMSFSGMINAVAIVAVFFVVSGLKLLFFDILDIIVLFAIVNIFVSIYMTRLLPWQTRRNLFKKVLKLLFRAKIEGLENLEKAGKRALIVTNHTSYLDVLLISTFVNKKIVFAINNQLMGRMLVKFMTNLVDVRPMDPTSPFAVKDMVEELEKDQICMIFTEGVIEGGNTRMKIYEAPALMAVKGEAPIVPIRIDGAKHAMFSRVLGAKAHFKWFPEITLTVLPPVDFSFPDNLTTRERREKSSMRLYTVMQEMTFASYDTDKTIFTTISEAMSMAGRFRPVLEDTERKPQKFMSMFMKSFILGKLITRAVPDDDIIGLMIPTSNTCVLSVLGLHAYGRVPAMINFTAGVNAVVATCKTVGLKTVVTARKVVLLAKLENLVEEIEKAGIKVLYLEDLRPTLKTSDKIRGIIGGFFPSFMYKKTRGRVIDANDPAVVLFTSGSEGMPKAVFLTHKNILANCYQIPSVFDLMPNEVFLNCLPLFHSFGLGAGTFLPLILGVKTFLYPTPLHYRIIPEICASVKATVFFGTDTFLAGYAKCANPYDFNSLRLVAGGAEKIKDETRKIWSEKFGVRLFEGYGATECSPFLAVNTFLRQKKDSVGPLLPGMDYKLVPVEGIKEGQELWVKGPNIMKGYMRYENPLVLDPPKDGWYDTGDIVTVDEDRFVSIKGRCKRFAKVGGEMVSLLAVEQVVEKNWPGFITGAVNIPDPKKGEQIVLITTCKDITKDKLIDAFKRAGVTELGIPSRVIATDTPPLLGTGKFDYVTAKNVANEEVNKA